jgi:hypothetical protein
MSNTFVGWGRPVVVDLLDAIGERTGMSTRW